MEKYDTIKFVTIECCNCHCLFMVTVEHKQRLVDEKTSFYCPNGHRQSYTGISDELKIKRLKKKISSCSVEKQDLQREIDMLEKRVKSYKMLYCKEKKKNE